jgi:hypothetical protein
VALMLGIGCESYLGEKIEWRSVNACLERKEGESWTLVMGEYERGDVCWEGEK